MEPFRECLISGKPHKLLTKSVSRLRAIKKTGGLAHYVVPFSTEKGQVFAVYVAESDLEDDNRLPDTLFPDDALGFRTSGELVEAYLDSHLYNLQTNAVLNIQKYKGDTQ